MKKLYLKIAMGVAMIAVVLSACQTPAEQHFETRWAGSSLEEIIASMESQFGGFDQTMMETNYRYNELYWAGVDGNWEYAGYQLDEMLGSLEKGFVRRPAREASAAQFLNTSAPTLMAAIKAGDKRDFMQSFTQFAASCNTCHAMEEVAFIQMIIPENRTSLVKFTR